MFWIIVQLQAGAGGRRGDAGRKKRVSKFDEQSHYAIENKGPGLRTKPNKAKLPSGSSPLATTIANPQRPKENSGGDEDDAQYYGYTATTRCPIQPQLPPTVPACLSIILRTVSALVMLGSRNTEDNRILSFARIVNNLIAYELVEIDLQVSGLTGKRAEGWVSG